MAALRKAGITLLAVAGVAAAAALLLLPGVPAAPEAVPAPPSPTASPTPSSAVAPLTSQQALATALAGGAPLPATFTGLNPATMAAVQASAAAVMTAQAPALDTRTVNTLATIRARAALPTATPRPTWTPIPTMTPLDTEPTEGRWVVLLERKQADSRTSWVEERRYPEDTAREVVRFDEQAPTHRGQYRASVALSPAGERLVYIAQDGIHVMHLLSGRDEMVVRRVPPTDPVLLRDWPDLWEWQHHAIGGMLVGRPVWSADGRYISLEQWGMEGGRTGILRLADGVGWRTTDAIPQWAVWAPSGARLALLGTDYGSPHTWLALRTEADFRAPRVLYGTTPAPPDPDAWSRPRDATPTPYPRLASVRSAAWSPDGATIAMFAASEHDFLADPPMAIGLLDVRGGDVGWLVELKGKEVFPRLERHWPIFDSGGTAVLYQHPDAPTELQTLSLRGGAPRVAATLPPGFSTVAPVLWISPAHLAVAAGDQATPGHVRQLLLIDVTTGEVRPITGLLPPYTSVLSVERLP